MQALIAGLLVSAAAPPAVAPVTPLFASDAPIQLTIQGPIAALVRNSERAPTTTAATLSLGLPSNSTAPTLVTIPSARLRITRASGKDQEPIPRYRTAYMPSICARPS